MPNKIPRDDLLAEIHRLYRYVDDVPTKKNMREHGKYSSHLYKKQFGSWSSAVEAAGFTPRQKYKHQVTHEELLAELVKVAEEIGTTPSQQEMTEHGEYPVHVYTHRFNSWNNALKEAGVGTREKYQKVSDEDLIEELRVFHMAFERPPTAEEIINAGDYGFQTYLNHFGSLKKALKEAGIPLQPDRETIPNEELITNLQKITEELGHAPSIEEFKEHSDISSYFYTEEFGNWTNALVECEVLSTSD